MRLFVTGTDTDVGKTVVSSALLAAARASGFETNGQKPIESGCALVDGELVANDATALAVAAAHEPDILFKYQLPLAPAIAAKEEGRPYPDIAACVAHGERRYTQLKRGGRPLQIIEGAGGLLVPLTTDALISDLAKAIGAPILIVARDGLGTINHTALTIQTARSLGLEVLAFVFSATGEVDTNRATSNAASIAAITGATYGGRLERLESTDNAALVSAGRRLPIFKSLPRLK